jgi:D-3-phosphoglycerate dehydrogenase / 2-oxoglutarate reductase
VKPRILVTPRSLTAGPDKALLDPLEDAGYKVVFSPAGRQPTESELMELLPACVGYLAGVEPVTATALEGARLLRVISRNGSGVDNIDMATTTRMGIEVRRATGANARGVAELALALMLCGLRAIPLADRSVRSGGWDRPRGREVDGRLLGIVGFGAVGREVAGLALAIGMRCVAYDPIVEPTDCPPGVTLADLDTVLREAEIVTLHCPALPSGQPLLGDREIGLLRPSCVLINTARWSLVDPSAALRALESGRLAAYAIDAFATEPPELGALLTHDRVIVTPHLGGLTEESVRRAAEDAVRNLVSGLADTSRGG